MAKLIPPDMKRCQTEITSYHPFIMGGDPHQTTRCEKKPNWIAKEKKPGDDGKYGSMSLCDEHKKICSKKMGRKVIFKKI